MITNINEFSLLENRKQILSLDEVISILKNNNLTKDNIIPIYRGITLAHDPFYLFDNSLALKKRESKNTSNYYTTWIDNNDRWKEYPKRSDSLICSMDYNYANDFGTVYYVIPVNLHTKIGICSNFDIWESFKFLFNFCNKNVNINFEPSMRIFNYFLKDLNINDNSYEQMVKDLNSIHKDVLLKNLGIKFNSKVKNFDDLLDPNNNEFKLEEYINMDKYIGDDKEVWLDDKALMISRFEYENVLKNL